MISDLEERIAVLEDIADGEPMVPTRVPLTTLFELLRPELSRYFDVSQTVDVASLELKPGSELIEVDVLASAPVKDRISAIGVIAKYGLGLPPREIHGKFAGKAAVDVVITRVRA